MQSKSVRSNAAFTMPVFGRLIHNRIQLKSPCIKSHTDKENNSSLPHFHEIETKRINSDVNVNISRHDTISKTHYHHPVKT